MHMDIGPYFDLESFHYMQASLTNLEHAQKSVETARTSLQKTLKKWWSNFGLEANSDQKQNVALFLDIQWSYTNWNQAFSLPKTPYKSPRTCPCNWDRESVILHPFAKPFE